MALGIVHALVSSGHREKSSGLLGSVVLVHCSMVPSRAAESKVSDDLRLYSAAIVNLNSLPFVSL